MIINDKPACPDLRFDTSAKEFCVDWNELLMSNECKESDNRKSASFQQRPALQGTHWYGWVGWTDGRVCTPVFWGLGLGLLLQVHRYCGLLSIYA